jgi:hypothetical protein
MGKIKDDFEKDSLKDVLKVEGISFKGFGHIPKFIMHDTNLSIEAKGIYAYFCSYAGSGNSAFPSRDKILKDLGVGTKKYYAHYNQLINNGYITAEQERKKNEKTGEVYLGNNIYTLIANPKKYVENIEQEDLHKNKGHSMIRNSGMKSLGYGTIAKAVMLDIRLPLKSKGIYAYFCSYAGSGNSAFPKLDNILHYLQISENTYYKYYRLLVDFNYITPVQRNIRGKFSINDYYINETPDEELIENKPSLKNAHTEEVVDNAASLPSLKNAHTQNAHTQNAHTQKGDTLNTNNSNTNSIYYNQSVSLNKQLIEGPEGPLDRQMEYEKIKAYFRDKLKFKDLKISHAAEKKLIDEIELNIHEMYFSNYIIIQGNKRSQELIRSALMKLTYWHIDALIVKFLKISSETKIKNLKSYIQTMIYNIVFESDLAMINELKSEGLI